MEETRLKSESAAARLNARGFSHAQQNEIVGQLPKSIITEINKLPDGKGKHTKVDELVAKGLAESKSSSDAADSIETK